ncbi:MAG: hypothetical protein ACR2LJ_05335 [Acidimicrobiales bacterium]
MEQQLTLVDTDERAWELDDHTREIGRRGLEQARRALQKASAQAA